MISVIKDVNLFEHVNEYDLNLLGTNVYCTLNNGFQRDVSIYYPYVHDMNLGTKYGDMSKLGTILECTNENNPTFVICYITKGFNFRPDLESDYLSYESLENCLKLVNILYKGKNVAAPLLGCSRFDGNGDRDRVFDIINKSITKLDLTIYDYYQKSRDEINKERYLKEQEVKKKDYYAYREMIIERKKKERETKKLNGRANF